jgi:uncharacterized RDD family membrane protein YckC
MDEPQQRPYLAEWWPRVGATLLDAVLISGMSFVLAIAVAIAGGSDDTTGTVWWIGWLLIGSAYVAGTMARKGSHNGQTWGKQAAGVRVVRDDGRPIRLGFGVLREVLLKYIVANLALGIGWIADSLWPLGDKENRAIHDMIVKTHVVTTRAPQPAIAQQQQRPGPPVARPVLAPPIARHVDAAHRIQAGIAGAVQRAQLPYTAVSTEVNQLVAQLEGSAMRAQMLYEALADTPVATVQQRLSKIGDLEQPELALALREQLVVQTRMQEQLHRFDSDMERMVVELDTIRANLVSTAASGDVENQERIAGRVRELRDEMSAVSEGMDAGYGT